MQDLFSEKPWVQPVAVAGSHIDEIIQMEEEMDKENILPEKRKIKHLIYNVNIL